MSVYSFLKTRFFFKVQLCFKQLLSDIHCLIILYVKFHLFICGFYLCYVYLSVCEHLFKDSLLLGTIILQTTYIK